MQKNGRIQSDQRMALLAKELGIAIFQVMTDYYQFDEAEANKAVQMVYEQARSNRAALQGAAIAAYLADDKPENIFSPEDLEAITHPERRVNSLSE